MVTLTGPTSYTTYLGTLFDGHMTLANVKLRNNLPQLYRQDSFDSFTTITALTQASHVDANLLNAVGFKLDTTKHCLCSVRGENETSESNTLFANADTNWSACEM